MYKTDKKLYSKRRSKLLSKLPDKSLIIIPNKKVSIRSNDVEYKFKSDPDFFYLTGFEEPNSICVLKKESKKTNYTLFLEERNKEKEIWIGKRCGTRGAKSNFMADESYDISQFVKRFEEMFSGVENIYFPIGKDELITKQITKVMDRLKSSNRLGKKTPKTIQDPREVIHKMRLYKDSHEIGLMRRAGEITKDAHILAMSLIKPGMYEYELEALVEYKFRSEGATGVSYPSIVGAGKNGTILHYIENGKKIGRNDLVLVDAGCEFENYAADLTRTYPSTKRFSSAQRDIYEIVLEAQLKCISLVKSGKTFKSVFDKSVSVIVDGLKSVGLLKGSKSDIVKKKRYKKFYMHNIGHWLGLDVHDAGPYVDDGGKSLKLLPGVVMTIEPGIYIPNEPEIPKEFRGIGIRIEDDVLVTKSGNEVFTDGAPKKISDIENLI